jgi:hypothetical protein
MAANRRGPVAAKSLYFGPAGTTAMHSQPIAFAALSRFLEAVHDDLYLDPRLVELRRCAGILAYAGRREPIPGK